MQPRPTLQNAPSIPLIPYFVGYKGQSINSASQINAVKIAEKLVEQIVNELQEPSQIPQHNTLEKFTLLVRVFTTMNASQIQQVVHATYYSASSKSNKFSQSETNKIFAW